MAHLIVIIEIIIDNYGTYCESSTLICHIDWLI